MEVEGAEDVCEETASSRSENGTRRGRLERGSYVIYDKHSVLFREKATAIRVSIFLMLQLFFRIIYSKKKIKK